ncbi:MAG: OmpA family protein [Gemmatimonadales bacterium]
MRSSRLCGVLMLGVVFELTAQRAHQFEFGGHGSVTRYDYLMGLDDRIGAGVRVGYLVTRLVGLEIEGGFAQPRTVNALAFTTVRWASASLTLNVGAGRRNLPYLLGGYTRIDYGADTDAPYDFGDHALHGAIGERFFIIEGVAIRLEGRAIFAPKTDGRFGGKWAGHLVGSFGLSMFATGRGPGDADRDRVSDRLDACPGTPAGAVVDPRGCPIDKDGDAVSDGLDRCPGTAAGSRVDGAGCPMDGDRDGVADGIDQCVDSPAGATVDAKGCPLDADADGVADPLDRCANTTRGVPVDSVGCVSARDSDTDGVTDAADRCPNTRRETRVDAIGCADLFVERGATALRGLAFGVGSATLTAGSYTVLDGVAAALLAHPEVRVEIAAYTDDAGAPAANLRLSQLRAEAVRGYLISRGVAANRLLGRGFGSANPIASNATAAGRAQNRRVELHRLP